MRKSRKQLYLVLIILLILGIGIGYSRIESLPGFGGFLSVRRNRTYYTLMPYTENTAYYKTEDMAKVKRIVFNDTVDNNSEYPSDMIGEAMLVTADGEAGINAYYTPNAEDPSLYDLNIIANGFITAPADSSNLFAGFTNLTEVVNPSKLVFDNVTNASNLFKDTKVTTLNLSAWNTANLTNVSNAFENVDMTLLNISMWNLSNVTDVTNMFKDAEISTLTLPSMVFLNDVDTSNMFDSFVGGDLTLNIIANNKLTGTEMFRNATLTSLTMNNFEVKGAESVLTDFANSSKIVAFVGNNWKMTGVSSLSGLFASSSELITVEMQNLTLPTSNEYDLTNMFIDNVKLTTVDLSSMNGETKVKIDSMFKNDVLLTSINLGNITGIKVLTLDSFVENDAALEQLDLQTLDFSEYTSIANAFVGCTNLSIVTVNNTFTTPEAEVVYKGDVTTIIVATPETPENP